MERFVKGEIVVFKFPFSDTLESKKRPALVIANTYNKNIILCKITSKIKPDPDIVTINQSDFEEGSLNRVSFARLAELFNIHESKINYKVGKLKADKILEVQNRLCEIFKR